MNNFKELFKIFKQGRIKKISNNMYQVDDYLVCFKHKKGRQVITCSCQNYSKFPNESFCFHRELAILYPVFEHFTKIAKRLTKHLEIAKQVGQEPNLDELITLIEEFYL